MKKLLSFFSFLMAFTFLSLPLLAQGTNTLAAKTSKTILVTFSVDMELWRLAGLFNPASDTVFIGGNFNAWEKTVMTVSQSNPDIYSTTISVTDSLQDTIRFNFVYSPDIWEVSGVHEFVITQSDYNNGLAATDTIGFNSEPPGDFPIRVEFRCNMGVEMKRGLFAHGDKVFVRGDFNSWSGIDYELKDVDGDSIYSRIFYNFKKDQKLTFKFTNNNAGKDNWESTANRTLTVSSIGANIYSAYWADQCCFSSKLIQVTFTVNMELERLSGLFNPAINKVSVRGSFNGWGETMMNPSLTNPDLYQVVADVIASVNEKISFRFFYSPGTWEENHLTDNTQNDRYFIVNYNSFESGSTFYDAIGFNNNSLETVLNQDAHITFTCNTNGAKIINTLPGTEFKTIHIAGGGFPLQWPSSGWTDSDSIKMVQLYDDGTHEDVLAGDKIFTTLITFPAYSKLTVIYKYSANWGLSTNGGDNDNEGGVGADKTLKMHRLTTNAVVIDTFGAKLTIILNVEKLDNTIPTAFKLEQNYPNPFNPETQISWQLAAGSFVTLKIYDVLGNEVATLVNEEQQAGSYQVEFSSKNKEVSSGVFFYQLRAGSFVQTKKMILLR